MLIGFPLGAVPWSFTTPRTLAVADPVLKEAGLAGLAARPPVRANNRIRPGTKSFVFTLHLTKFITRVMKLDQPGCPRAYCMMRVAALKIFLELLAWSEIRVEKGATVVVSRASIASHFNVILLSRN
jgi:hypothetical protein